MNEFQERLQELLIEYKMSRLQLAKFLKISSTTLNGYFNKNYYPDIEIAIHMSKFFNCSIDYLLGLTDNKKSIKMNNKSFFENFDDLIKQSGLSIAQTMKNLKMSEYNYYRWRDGLFPKTVNLIDISKYFETSIVHLIGNKIIN